MPKGSWSRLVRASAGIVVLAVPAGCRSKSSGPEPPATFVVLVDKSASIDTVKANAYVRFLRQSVFPSLTPGSRVVVEPIVGANTFGDPEERVTATLPSVTPLTKDASYFLLKGDMSLDKNCMARVTRELGAFNNARDQLTADAVKVFRGKGASSSTFLVDGMKEASEMLEPRKGRGVLVVLSDGLEDSDAFGQRTKFGDPGFWTRNSPPKLVRELNPAQTTPGLRNAKVYFFGMAAAQGRVYESVRRFWTDYFQAARAESAALGHEPVYEEPAYAPQAEDLCK